MSDLKVSTRLMMLIVVLSALLLGVGAFGLWGVHKTEAALESVYSDRLEPTRQLAEISDRLMRDRVALAAATITPDTETIAASIEVVESNVTAAEKVWKEYLATNQTIEEKALAQTFAAAQARFVREGLLPTMAALRANDVVEAKRLVADVLRPLFNPVRETSLALQQLQDREAKREFQEARQRYQLLRTAFFVVIIGGLLAAVAMGYWIARSIGHQLGAEPAQASALARRVASGDLSVDIALRPGDDTSLMSQLQVMQSSLARVVAGVRANAEGVATASAQIAQGNLDLSQRTEEQASALEETSAAMEELGITVTQNAGHAEQANQLAAGASAVAGKGGEVVGQVIETMKAINESSTRIADIVGVIDSIAFQTNILALNAAVEAARAGEQGRGFAVVAGEVRGLAQRVAQAAKEIKDLIGTSVERVDKGALLVDQAGQTMREILASIHRVAGLMSEINTATNEQSVGVAQVGQAVSQMDQTTQQNAALVEQSAAAAENLRSQAEELLRAVEVFKLSDSGASRGTAKDPLQTRSKGPLPSLASASPVALQD